MKYDWVGPYELWPEGVKHKAEQERAGVYVLDGRRREVLAELLELGYLTGSARSEAESLQAERSRPAASGIIRVAG